MNSIIIIEGPGGIYYRHKHHSVLQMCSRNSGLNKCTVVCQRLTYKTCIMTALVLTILLVVTSEQVHEKPHMSNYIYVICDFCTVQTILQMSILQKGPTAKMVDGYHFLHECYPCTGIERECWDCCQDCVSA